MKRNQANESQINVVPLETRSEAAGSEKGAQVIPAIVGVLWAIEIISIS
jgi:hypothetical protein